MAHVRLSSTSSEEALQHVLDHYVNLWRIEDFFRVLKSGCKVERALRLERAIAIYCVIAWRLMVLTLLGRTVPQLDSDVFFTEWGLRFLTGYAGRVKLPRPGTLQEAILLVAVLGGTRIALATGRPVTRSCGAGWSDWRWPLWDTSSRRRVTAALRCDNPCTVILSQGRIPIPCRGFLSTVSKASTRKAGRCLR